MNKNLITLAIVAAAIGGAYVFLRKRCEADASGMFCPFLLGVTHVPPPIPDEHTQPGTTPPDTTTPPVTDPWAIAAAVMKRQAGSTSENLDQWQWFWHKSPVTSGAPTGFGVEGYVTTPMLVHMIDLAGGDRFKAISAEMWLGYLKQTLKDLGLSGLGWFVSGQAFPGAGIGPYVSPHSPFVSLPPLATSLVPAAWIHGGGYARNW